VIWLEKPKKIGMPMNFGKYPNYSLEQVFIMDLPYVKSLKKALLSQTKIKPFWMTEEKKERFIKHIEYLEKVAEALKPVRKCRCQKNEIEYLGVIGYYNGYTVLPEYACCHKCNELNKQAINWYSAYKPSLSAPKEFTPAEKDIFLKIVWWVFGIDNPNNPTKEEAESLFAQKKLKQIYLF